MGELNCSAKVAKLILFVCNLAVMLAGIALLAVGIWFVSDPYTVHLMGATGGSGYHDMVRAAGGIIIFVGIVLFVIGLVGCWGAMRQKTGCLNCFSAILVVLVILEIVAAILAGVFHGQITGSLTKNMNYMLTNDYGKTDTKANNLTTTSWNFMQNTFSCCGVTNYTDWQDSWWMNNTQNVNEVPDTCCHLNNSDYDRPKVTDRNQCNTDARNGIDSARGLHGQGCEQKFEDWVSYYLGVLIAVVIVVIIIEVTGVILSCVLVARIKTGYEYV